MKKTVGLVEKIVVIGEKRLTCYAKFDTGALGTSIDYDLAKKIKLKPTGKNVIIKSASVNKGVKRPVVIVKLKIKDKTFKTKATLSDRSHSKQKVLVGRNIIFNNFIIDISKTNKSPRSDDIK
ncbi:MAG: retropepsin-like domain-containing protein [Candidatus Aenigmarchaeota archaeon]|nr:retropepsin-like domain-containing protein [Candidatus Aenigmarchaeota archaeon]